jgi:hypothetical protein
MPVELVSEAEAISIKRPSKLSRTAEWIEAEKILKSKIPANQVVRITFCPETKKQFKNDEKKAAVAFAVRLRKDYGKHFKIRVVSTGEDTELQIRNLDKK